MDSFLNHFSLPLKKIDDALNQSLGARVPVVSDIVRYALLGAGKRIRPLLFVLSSASLRIQREGCVPALDPL